MPDGNKQLAEASGVEQTPKGLREQAGKGKVKP